VSWEVSHLVLRRQLQTLAQMHNASPTLRLMPHLPLLDPCTTTPTPLRRILRDCRTIAVVGLSAEWHRPSYFAAKYMQQHGWRIVPVNPRYAVQADGSPGEVLGERCYAALVDIPFQS
jgi:hypothetical protein